MYCLDTNIIIDILREDERLKSRIFSLNSQIFTTTLTLCELYKGAYLASRTQDAIKLINNFLDSVDLLTLDTASSEEFGKEFAKLQKSGKMTQEIDLMIATIAKTNNLTLVTRNKKDFENINVKIEVW